MNEYRPRVISFFCNWCTYAASDLAGVNRLTLPPDFRVVRVMCSGSLDPEVIVEAFVAGADGVFIGGCHPGDCHYISGNYLAEQKVRVLKELLGLTDLEPGRLRLEWISASEATRYQELITQFIGQITDLGPSQIGTDRKLKQQLLGVQTAVRSFRLRAIAGRMNHLITEGNVYGETISQSELDTFLTNLVSEEYLRARILNSIRCEPKSAEEIATTIDHPVSEVFNEICFLWKNRFLAPVGERDYAPLFTVLNKS